MRTNKKQLSFQSKETTKFYTRKSTIMQQPRFQFLESSNRFKDIKKIILQKIKIIYKNVLSL